MNLDKSKLVDLSKIPEMDDEERKWLRTILKVESGYFEAETGEFVILVTL
ncbi:MAG: hypothetical protein UV60_C0010G0003 [Parcubacteria group bacterium GW2011_GWA2_43_11]|nr:MAG: hypothetical protein UU89_C0022G0005 [Parcubacteria group bacterium GW2011_GWC2_42_11]KKS85185.1 MAG: hypothetical protein UV60_C0010G0003 [Parcubacteria group bacterium GW2011_GWA2_43_11]